MLQLRIESEEKLLIVAPHPDDECIGAGGILCKYHNQCDVWLISDGNYSNKFSTVKGEFSRQEEYEAEMKYLGVNDYRLFNVEDGALSQNIDLLMDVSLSEYSKIFVTYGQDAHIDHASAFCMVRKALRKQKLTNKVELYEYEVTTPLNSPTHYLDISSEISEKAKLISFHKSQMVIHNYGAIAKFLNRYRAEISGYEGGAIECYQLSNQNADYNENELIEKSKIQKLNHFINLYCRWLRNYIYADCYKLCLDVDSIIIYGFKKMGKTFYSQCLRDGIKVEYIIDNGSREFGDEKYKIYTLDEVDVSDVLVVVTVIHEYQDVKEMLQNKGYYNIVSLEDIINKKVE